MLEENAIQFKHILSPFSFFYGLGVRFRNLLFNKGILSSEQYPVPVICIGNLAVGGTGKTPHTELIIRILKDKHRIAVLSRGYKRKTKGFILADAKSTSAQIGDEPYQIKQKFPDIIVAVDANRRRGINYLLSLKDEKRPGIILLDDGFQHRYVTPSLSIMLTDFNRLFYKDKLLPVGHLREPASGIRRADVVVVTKCIDDLKPIDYRIIEQNIDLWAHQHLYFTKIVYGNLMPVFPGSASKKIKTEIHPQAKVLLVTGIAEPAPLIKEVEKLTQYVSSLNFPDHHDFKKQDIRKIEEVIQSKSIEWILTTEKDAARLKNNSLVPRQWKKRLFYLPITLEFCSNSKIPFDKMLFKHLSDFKKNSILLLNK